MSTNNPLASRTAAPQQGYASLRREGAQSLSSSQDAYPPTHGFIRYFCATQGPPQVVAVAFLTTFSYGAIVAVLPKVSTQRFAELNYGADEACDSFESYHDKPQACLLGSGEAQDAHAFSELVANMLMVLTGPLFGAISDSHGRWGLFALGTILATLGNFAFLYVCVSPTSSPWIFYYFRSFHGVVNWMAVALASLADVMPPHLRAPAVGLVMAAYWFGVCVGPTFAVFLGDVNAAVFSCVMALSAICMVLFFVPETLSPYVAEESKRKIQQDRSNRTLLQEVIWNLFRPFQELSIVNRDSFFRLLSMLAFFNGMVTAGDKVLLLYYADSKLSFTMKDTAIMLLLYGVGSVIAQAIILKPLNDWIGERLILVVCFVAAVFANASYGLADSKGALFAGIGLASFTGMAFPTFSAIKANNVDESEQGRIQGALYSILALASGLGPVLMRYIDHIASDSFLGPGAMFFFAAFLQLFSSYFAFLLPEDKSNSKNLRTGKSDDEDDIQAEEMVTL